MKTMTTMQRTKRFRPRFSIRTLAIVITLACCYAACWGPTKRRGFEAVYNAGYRLSESSEPRGFVLKGTERLPAPLIVVATRIQDNDGETSLFRSYYFWFFGFVTKLPWERDITEGDSLM